MYVDLFAEYFHLPLIFLALLVLEVVDKKEELFVKFSMFFFLDDNHFLDIEDIEVMVEKKNCI